jgi:hypothetical protein
MGKFLSSSKIFEYDSTGDLIHVTHNSYSLTNSGVHHTDRTKHMNYIYDSNNRVVRIHHDLYYANYTDVVEKFKYDENGNCISRKIFYRDKSGKKKYLSKTKNYYDKDNRIIYKSVWEDSASLYKCNIHYTEYQYNEIGLLESTTEESYDGTQCTLTNIKTFYRYNNKNLLIAEDALDTDTGDSLYHDSYKYEYDDHDRLIKKSSELDIYDTGEVYEYKYNENGQRIEKKLYAIRSGVSEEFEDCTIVQYEYDNNGHCIVKNEYWLMNID